MGIIDSIARAFTCTNPHPFLTTAEFNDSAVVAFIARFYFFAPCPACCGADVGSKSRFRVQFRDHVWSLNNSFPRAHVVVRHWIIILYNIGRYVS